MSIPTGGLPILATLYSAGGLPIVDNQGLSGGNYGLPVQGTDVANKTYVDAASIAVAPADHNSTTAVALYKLVNDATGVFDGTDSVSGLNLTLESGPSAVSQIHQSKRGVILASTSNAYAQASAGTALDISGDLTIQCFIYMSKNTGTGTWFMMYGNAPATTHQRYGIGMDATTPQQLRYGHSSSTGAPNVFYTPVGAYMPVGQLCDLAMTRTSNVIQFYLNGLPFGAASGTLTAPGGVDAADKFRIGFGGGSSYDGLMMRSLKICASSLNAARIKADYNATLGPVYGLVP